MTRAGSLRGTSFAVLGGLVALVACSKSPDSGVPGVHPLEPGSGQDHAKSADAHSVSSNVSPTPAAGQLDAGAHSAEVTDRGDSGARVAVRPTDGGAEPSADARDGGSGGRLAGKVVLHAGDSMVGGDGGLTKALGAKFRAEGAKFVRDYEVSLSIGTFARTQKLKSLLVRHKPDIVILTLGANDVFIPFPQNFVSHVETIVKKISDRECYWIGPPTWKPDSGIVGVIRDHVAPCKFFDSSNLPLKRAGDHIHPTEKGGADWAELFWAYYQGTGSAAPGLLDAGVP